MAFNQGLGRCMEGKTAAGFRTFAERVPLNFSGSSFLFNKNLVCIVKEQGWLWIASPIQFANRANALKAASWKWRGRQILHHATGSWRRDRSYYLEDTSN